MADRFTDSLEGCARCGKDHVGLTWKRMFRPVLDEEGVAWDYWATCPLTGDPILLSTSRIAEREGAATDNLINIAFETQYVAFPITPYQLWIASNNAGGWYWWCINGSTDTTITESSETFSTPKDAKQAAVAWFLDWYKKDDPNG